MHMNKHMHTASHLIVSLILSHILNPFCLLLLLFLSYPHILKLFLCRIDVRQTHQPQPRIDILRPRSRYAPVRRRLMVRHDGVHVPQEWNAKDNVADTASAVECAVGLDEPDTGWVGAVAGGVRGEVEGVDRDGWSVVEGDGDVEWSRAWQIVWV